MEDRNPDSRPRSTADHVADMSAPSDGQLWRISVDADACIGSAMCTAIASAYFQLEDDRSHPVHEQVTSDHQVLAAADCCPSNAITVHDVRTGTRIVSGA
jgi:ferredoxin